MKTSLLSWTMVLVTTALVACGDDGETTSGTGTGGSGGSAATTTTGAGTPTSSSSGTPTTTSSSGTPTSSSSGGEGGDPTGGGGQGGTGAGEQGGGGSGQGGEGAGNCTAITIDDLEGGPGDNGQGQIVGLVNPALGGDDDDFGVIEFWDDGKTFNGGVPGTYDLSDEQDYATCSRCVLVYEDATEAAVGRTYLQASGELTLEEEGNDIAATGRGTFSLSDVVLVEVEIGDGGVTTPVADGACLFISSLEFSDPAPVVPDTWTCDPTYYAALDGCDCLCGAYDPDCDLPEEPVLNCEDGEYCIADGTCGDVPVWWTCDDAELGDGTTCNCECGGPDPDCENEANPIEGCVGEQTCTSLGECVDPESICDDLTDNDDDGLFDCDDDTACTGSAACTPGAGAIGSECDANTDCSASDGDPFCLSEELFQFNGGACGEWCDLDADDCGAGNICLDLGVDRGVCAPRCDDDDDCRADAHCVGTAPDTFCIADPAACFDPIDDLVDTVTGDTTDGVGAPSGSCEGGFFAPPGLAVLYEFTSGAAGDYTFTLASATDQGVSIREECGADASELACQDVQVGGTDEVLVVTLEAATTYTVLAQAYADGEEGPFTLTVDGP